MLLVKLQELLQMQGFKTMLKNLFGGAALVVELGKNYQASCVSHEYSYGGFNAIEIASMHEDAIEYSNPVVEGDVLGHLSVDEAFQKVLEMKQWVDSL